MGNSVLKPLFKYPGGKSSELKHLKKLLPEFDTYIEPFLGGGAVYWATEAKNFIINDYSEELVNVYLYSKIQDPLFLTYIKDIASIWHKKNSLLMEVIPLLHNDTNQRHHDCLDKTSQLILEVISKLPKDESLLKFFLSQSIVRRQKSLAKISERTEINNWDINALGALGAGIYTYIRSLYNKTSIKQEPELKTALFLFLREYAYSSMFRFNNSGGFNVPFGGNTYAKKDFSYRVEQITDDAVISKLSKTKIMCGDFADAFTDMDSAFMFLDPPYDTDFSTYNLQIFDAKEQIRLRDELIKIKKTKWLMITKSTDFIEELYEREGWYKSRFDKLYSVNFKNRNDQKAEHLIITNYQLGQEKY